MRLPTKRFFTCSGCDLQPVYSSKVLENGIIEVTKIGEESIQEKIQSYADSCSLELIMQRCARGDFSSLSVHQGVYADVTGMPKTYAEVLQHVIDGRNMFNSLDPDVRRQFDNSFEKWCEETGSLDWFSKMGVKLESSSVSAPKEPASPPKDVVKEVLADES